MVKDFIEFTRALWEQWKALLTGGSIIALLSLWDFATRKVVPRSLDWLILGLTLLIAAFLSWRKEWLRNESQFITITPEELTSFFQNRTEFHADLYVKPYIGKRIKSVARIEELSRFDGGSGYVHMINKDGITLHGLMPRRKISELALLAQEGAAITVTGRINRISITGIGLDEIEVVGIQSGDH
jgi:hypothetical protein